MEPYNTLADEPVEVIVEFPRAYEELFNPYWRYLIYEGGRGSLKSHSIARSLLIRGREKKMRFLCTREYQKSIADSVHKLLSDLILAYEMTDWEVQKQSITNTVTGSEFIFAGLHNNVAEIKSMEGIDVCWVEEAHATTKASWDILTPTIRKPGSQIIASFNRTTELDPVYVKFILKPPRKTYHAKVNYDYAMKLGWLPDVLIDEMEDDKENYPQEYAHKWLGEPIQQSDDAILNRVAVLAAMNDQHASEDGQIIVGADIARKGDDRTVLWKRKGDKTIGHEIYAKKSVDEVVDLIIAFVDGDKSVEIRVDDTGVGGGVTDYLKRNGYNVVPINFGQSANDKDKYPNWISEAWFHLQKLLPQIEIPMSNELLMELSTRNWKQDQQGRRRVESKDDYKKRGFRSPDIADAMILCYAPPVPRIEWAAPSF